jgi:hypothetical protein
VLITILIKSTSISCQTLVKVLVKPLAKPLIHTLFGTFCHIFEFHLNTLKSANTKVVPYLREHISSHWRHCKSWVRDIQNSGQNRSTQFHRALHPTNFNRRSRSNHCSNTMSPFVNVVGYTSIYNFGLSRFLTCIHCWRWNFVNLAMSLSSVLAWILYLIHWY